MIYLVYPQLRGRVSRIGKKTIMKHCGEITDISLVRSLGKNII